MKNTRITWILKDIECANDQRGISDIVSRNHDTFVSTPDQKKRGGGSYGGSS